MTRIKLTKNFPKSLLGKSFTIYKNIHKEWFIEYSEMLGFDKTDLNHVSIVGFWSDNVYVYPIYVFIHNIGKIPSSSVFYRLEDISFEKFKELSNYLNLKYYKDLIEDGFNNNQAKEIMDYKLKLKEDD